MFHDVRFPTALGFGAVGGPERRTEIVALASGREERNTPWADSRRRYDAGYGLRSRADLEAAIAFFEARRGRLHGFRFRDPLDHASAPSGAPIAPDDQPLGIGDGARTAFALSKTYGAGLDAYVRPIALPVSGSVRIAIDGVETTAFTSVDRLSAADPSAAEIQLDEAPATGAVLTAGFAFDTPVRFDADALSVNLAAFDAGEIPSIPLVEIRL
ncbi:MAG: DUF2460 domain-containing protein [Pseudomonadota bacterium]